MEYPGGSALVTSVAVAQVRSLARELLHVVGTTTKQTHVHVCLANISGYPDERLPP